MAKEKIEYECSCGKKYPKWQGKCDACGTWNSLEEKVIPSKTYRLPKVSLKRKEQNKQPEIEKDLLDKWFNERIAEAKKICKCENCGKDVMNQLNSTEVWVSRASIAHIFPKRKAGGFPSVSCHELNWVLLCIDCHTEMDANYDRAKKMKVWEHVCRKARIFSHLITEPKSKLPPELFVD